MTTLNWFVLILYILIPSVLTFSIIFGVWRLIAFLVKSFQGFVRKTDGMPEMERKNERESNTRHSGHNSYT